MKEQLFLPEPPYRIGDIEINSSNILRYLITYDESVFNGKIDFAPTLDLEVIEPYLSQLYLTEQADYIFSKETRDQFENFELSNIPNEVIREIERQRRNDWKDIILDQKPTERAQTIYYDQINDSILATSIEHGKFAETTTDTFNVFKRGFSPLFEVHTHPFNRLFSTQDYLRMIMGLMDNYPYRLLKSAIVLCPDCQIMALATPKTLLLTSRNLSTEINLFLEKYNLDKSDIGRRIDDISKHFIDMINKPYEISMNLYAKNIQEMEEEYRYYERGLYSGEELNIMRNNLVKRYRKDVKETHSKNSNYINSPEVDNLIIERTLIYIKHGLELAQDINPKLYFATDFRHFKEFSA